MRARSTSSTWSMPRLRTAAIASARQRVLERGCRRAPARRASRCRSAHSRDLLGGRRRRRRRTTQPAALDLRRLQREAVLLGRGLERSRAGTRAPAARPPRASRRAPSGCRPGGRGRAAAPRRAAAGSRRAAPSGRSSRTRRNANHSTSAATTRDAPAQTRHASSTFSPFLAFCTLSIFARLTLTRTRSPLSAAISSVSTSSVDADDLAVQPARGHDVVALLDRLQHLLLLALALAAAGGSAGSRRSGRSAPSARACRTATARRAAWSGTKPRRARSSSRTSAPASVPGIERREDLAVVGAALAPSPAAPHWLMPTP